MARIGVLRHGQSVNDKPSCFVSKSVAALLIRRLLAEKVSKRVIKELQPRALCGIKEEKPRLAVIPKLKPPRCKGLLLQYPLPDQSSYASANRQRIWSRKEVE